MLEAGLDPGVLVSKLPLALTLDPKDAVGLGGQDAEQTVLDWGRRFGGPVAASTAPGLLEVKANFLISKIGWQRQID